MSYNNNKKNLITVKVTAKGREKIATGNLNLEKWSIGDSEVNYVREDFLVDNNITDKPSRILRAADQQPQLKYFITNESGDIRNTLNDGDISVLKLITQNNTSERGFYEFNNITQINTQLTKANGSFVSTSFQNDVINGTYNGVAVGDILLLNMLYDEEGMAAENYIYYTVVSFTSNTIKVNRTLPIKADGDFKYYVFDSGEVETVNRWNVPVQFNWNSDVLDYDMQVPNNHGTKVWNFNIITNENIAGYYNREETLGYEFIGFMENYLSYNDSLNVDSPLENQNNCSTDMTDGKLDDFQKMVGIIHFTNDNYSNLYGDVFNIDPDRGRNFTLKLSNVFHHKQPNDKLELKGLGEKKYILDSDIEYYDMVFDSSNLVVGKVLPQYKVFVIEDEELLMAMSIGSGRNYTLPDIKTQLVPSITTDGILPNGKQMFITYATCKTNDSSTFNKFIHCNRYNKIVNNTPSSKNIALSFNSDDFKLFFGLYLPITMVQSIRIVYQITDIGARPDFNNWKELNLSTDLNVVDNLTNAFENTEKLRDINYQMVIGDLDRSTAYNLKTSMLLNNNVGLVGDETFFLGNIVASISSNIYRSIISLNINPNVFTKTTNPTYNDVNGVKPYISVSEIGIYDKDDDLVMIGKLTKPQNLLNNSTIKLELGLDF